MLDPRRRDGTVLAPGQQERSSARILGWTTLVALIVAVTGFVEPVDDYLRMVRNLVRAKAPSGQIAIVGVDDASLERIGTWPWTRVRHAELLDRLKQAGAARIFYDVSFASASGRRQDAAFARSLERAGNVELAAMRVRDPTTGQYRFKLPRPEFRERAGLVSVAVRHSSAFSVRKMDFAADIDGVRIPTISASLARREGPPDTSFMIDYAIDPRKVPFVSAADLLEGRLRDGTLRGKDVVIGAASTEMGDVYYIPGVGQINGVYVHVVAAETLKSGGTTALLWFVPVLAALALMAMHLLARNCWLRRSALLAGIAGVSIGPVFAEMHGIFYDVMPATILIGATAGSFAWRNFRQSYKVRGNINAISGLPNLNALRDETPVADAVVVGARVRNFAEISSSLPPEGERALVDQIVARLALGARGARIYQGDEGIFVWTTSPEVAGPDQLDALHALFR